MLEKVVAVAKGTLPAELVIKKARVINPYTHKIQEKDIAITKGIIAGIGENYEGEEIIDAKGLYAVAGFIDSYSQMEYSYLTPTSFSRLILPHGITTLIEDPSGVASVWGKRGIEYIAASGELLPIDFMLIAPLNLPRSPFETVAEEIDAEIITSLLDDEICFAVGGISHPQSIIEGDPIQLSKLTLSEGAIKIGYSYGLKGKDLCSYYSAGFHVDAGYLDKVELIEKISLGAWIIIRRDTPPKKLEEIISVLVQNPNLLKKCLIGGAFLRPDEIIEEGYLEYILKLMTKKGINPMLALNTATLNPALCWNLKEKGIIAPGKIADIILLKDLNEFKINSVIKDGVLVVQDGEILGNFIEISLPLSYKKEIPIPKLEDIQVPATGKNLRVIKINKNSIQTELEITEPKVVDGKVVSDIERDILKVIVLERHTQKGKFNIGFVKGFGLKRGAIGTSVSWGANNIVVVGVDDKDIIKVLEFLTKEGGGLVVGTKEKMLKFNLPVAGLMSQLDAHKVIENIEELENYAKQLGTTIKKPFTTLEYLTATLIPKIRITDKGLVDVTNFKIIDLLF